MRMVVLAAALLSVAGAARAQTGYVVDDMAVDDVTNPYGSSYGTQPHNCEAGFAWIAGRCIKVIDDKPLIFDIPKAGAAQMDAPTLGNVPGGYGWNGTNWECLRDSGCPGPAPPRPTDTGPTCFGGKPEDCRFGPDPALRHDGWYGCPPPLGVRVRLWSDWRMTISCEEQPKETKP